MSNEVKVALIFALFSICFIWCLFLIISISVNVVLISFDKDNKDYVKWNRLNTIFISEYLSENSLIKREKVKLDILKLLGNVAILIVSFNFLDP